MSTSHNNRVHVALTGFTSAHDAFTAALQKVPDSAAMLRPDDGGWTGAQIGLHVALATEHFAAILTGAQPIAIVPPAGFHEIEDPFGHLAAKVKTPLPALDPPASVTRADALARLRASSDTMAEAIVSLTEERATGLCVPFPFGMLSLYQVAEFAALHVSRHQAQLQRALARHPGPWRTAGRAR